MVEIVALLQTGRAHLPEQRAYQKFLEATGKIQCHYVKSLRECSDPSVSAVIIPLGYIPPFFLRRTKVIADLQSMSVRRPRMTRDLLKRYGSRQPDVRIAQSPWMAARFRWPLEGTLIRPMGFDASLVEPRSPNPDFDVVYAGSLRRSCILESIQRLATWGLRIAVAGEAPHEKLPRNVNYLGVMPQTEVFKLYSRARFGLSVLPSVGPYQFQEITKVIEYAAAGLPTLGTETRWMTEFTRQHNGNFLPLTAKTTRADIDAFRWQRLNVSDREWTVVLKRSGILGAVQRLLSE